MRDYTKQYDIKELTPCKVHSYAKEEAISRRYIINLQSCFINRSADILQSVSYCESKFQCKIGSSFLHMVAANAL